MYTTEVEVQLLRAIVEQDKLACLYWIHWDADCTTIYPKQTSSHFHMAVFLTLCDKALLLQVSWGLLPEWMLDGTVYINVWNRHLIPIPTPIPITTIPTPIPITTIPTPPKRTTNDSDSDSDSGIGVGIVVWFWLRSRNRPRSGWGCIALYVSWMSVGLWSLPMSSSTVYCVLFTMSAETIHRGDQV